MTFVAHTMIGLAISRFFPNTPQSAAIAFSLIPDADHVFMVLRYSFRREGFLRSRTILHELIGAACWGIVGLGLMLIDSTLGELLIVCTSIHLFLDFISGASTPLYPYSNFQIDFRFKPILRAIEELVVIICSGAIFLS